jgi:hypothetical protein
MRQFVCALATSSLFIVASPAQAVVKLYTLNMTGPSEFPANASPGTGSGTVSYDDVAHTLSINVSFSGLTGTTTAAHIHAPTTASGLGSEAQASAAMNASVATQLPSFVGFPLGVTSGNFLSVLDLTQSSSWNPSYITNNGGTPAGAEAAFAAALGTTTDSRAYFNIHTSTFGGGEIRGFTTLIPEPTAAVLAGLSFVAFSAIRRRRK